MIKLFKWIYDLGYKAGWDDACHAANEGYAIIPSTKTKNKGREEKTS